MDLVLEDRRGRLVAVEVKASATVTASDFKSMRDLSEALGSRFVRGLVLYTGEEPIPFGAKLLAMPVSALWRLTAR